MALDAGTRPANRSTSNSGDASVLGNSDPKKAPASTTKKVKRIAAPPAQIEGRNVLNVDGTGMNCLIRAMLVAAGFEDYIHGDPDDLVAAIRADLNSKGFAESGRMLDLAGAAGAALISILIDRSKLSPSRGLILYQRSTTTGRITPTTIITGSHPLRLWLSNEHFQALSQNVEMSSSSSSSSSSDDMQMD